MVTEIRRLGQALTQHRREKLVHSMELAVEAYGRRRYEEARKALRPLLESVPDAGSVQEITGLVAYHLGRWKDTVTYLTRYEASSSDLSHRAVLMDAERALRHHRRVEELFEDLRSETPPADLLTEARIVWAGTLADRGEVNEAITVLNKGGASRALRNPSARHLRQWYTLAALYERGGDLPKARELYARILGFDAEAYDVAERLKELGGASRKSKPKPRQRSTKR